MYCSNCGKKIKEGINFCPYCGKKASVGVDLADIQNLQKSKNKSGNKFILVISFIVIIIVVTALLFILQSFGGKEDSYKEKLRGKWTIGDQFEVEDDYTEEDCIEKISIDSGEDGIWEVTFSGDDYYRDLDCEIYPDDEYSGGMIIFSYATTYKIEYVFDGYDNLYLSGDIKGKLERSYESYE